MNVQEVANRPPATRPAAVPVTGAGRGSRSHAADAAVARVGENRAPVGNTGPRSWALRLWLAAGAGDALTGALLLARPEWVLELLGEPAGQAGLVAWRWLGVFVLAVGLAYVFPLLAPARGRPRLPAVAEVTALVRCLVALFVGGAVMASALPAGWWLVAATDAGIAAAQLAALRRGWLDGGP